ncbi:MAG: hypothetical protein AAF968_15615, partial [Pseudomonadota bacterium]
MARGRAGEPDSPVRRRLNIAFHAGAGSHARIVSAPDEAGLKESDAMIWDMLRGEFIDVIEWTDDTR